MKTWYNDATASFQTFKGETAEERATVVSKPTPGPWRHQHEGDDHWVDHPNPTPQCPTRTKTICRISFSPNTQEATANARLITAAPEMLEAIQAALRIESLWMPPDEQNDPEYDAEFAALATMRNMFRAVIAKAKGEPYRE